MSQKNIAHRSEVTHRPSKDHSRKILFVPIIVLAVILAVALANIQPGFNTAISSDSIEAVSYNNALEMQYAQPWLDKQSAEAAPAVSYSDALALQYALPWLKAQQTTGCNGRLDMFYACQDGYEQP